MQNRIPFSLTNLNSLSGNSILDALPNEEYERFLPFLEPVTLSQWEFIHRPKETIEYVYFPNSGIISVTSFAEDGRGVEIGMVGKEGMVGMDVLLGVDLTPLESMVQISGEGFRVKTNIVRKEFKQCGTFQDLLLRYIHAFLVQISQTAVCNQLHTVEQKLVTRMMICRSRTESDSLPLTQDFIATMLGVNRPTVTLAAIKLQNEGLIEYKRGKINILNARGLESLACDCYQTVKTEYSHLSK